MKQTRSTLSFGLGVLSVIAVFVAIVNLFAYQQLVEFLEANPLPNGSTLKASRVIIRSYTLLAFCGVMWLVLHKDIQWKQKIVDVVRVSAASKLVYVVGGAVIALRVIFQDSVYFAKEGMFEQVVAALFIVTSLVLLFGVTRVSAPGRGRSFVLLVGLVFFVLGMEEISWGQVWFKWYTPDMLVGLNYQDETNLHNLLNPLFGPLYALFCFAVGYVLFFSDEVKTFFDSSASLKSIMFSLPSKNFALLGLVFISLSLLNIVMPYLAGELTEEIFAMFGVVYATSLFKSVPRKPLS